LIILIGHASAESNRILGSAREFLNVSFTHFNA
jgi:hypothetical protein